MVKDPQHSQYQSAWASATGATYKRVCGVPITNTKDLHSLSLPASTWNERHIRIRVDRSRLTGPKAGPQVCRFLTPLLLP